MNNIMLDTDTCLYIIKNQPFSIQKKLGNLGFGEAKIASLSVAEIYAHAYRHTRTEKNLIAIDGFLNPFEIIDFTMDSALHYGRIKASLEKNKRTMNDKDIIIAACALSIEAKLITPKQEFQYIKGLKTEDWNIL